MSSPRLPGQRRFSEGGLWSIIFPQYRDCFHNTPFRKCFEFGEKVSNLCWMKLMLMAARLSLSPYNRSLTFLEFEWLPFSTFFSKFIACLLSWAVKNYLLFQQRGGYLPHSAKQWFSVKGGGYPQIPQRKKNAENSYFWPQNSNFSPCWQNIILGKVNSRLV